MDDISDYMVNERKVYVAVTEDRTADGLVLPRSFVWENGVRYDIDRVIDVRRAASLKAGGVGVRYTVKIRGRERYMFLEDNDGRWFLEKPE
jgi:hypothetical protein